MKIGAIGIRTKIIVGDAATWYLVKKYLDNVVIKGGITPEERSKLAGIEENANDYTHPETHPSSILDVVDVVNGDAKKFLNERGEMVAISSIGVTGSQLYASTEDSDVAGYKSLVGTPQALETEIVLTAKSSDGIVWGSKYLSEPFTEAVTIPATAYGFDYWRKVSASNGTSRKHLRVFLYRAGVETNISAPLISPDINDTEFTERQISYIFPELALLAGDRIGIQEGFSTTHANNITLTYIVGDGRGWFMRLPLPLKHENLTEKNSEAAVQHVDTTTVKATLAVADKVPIFDSETGEVVLTPKSNIDESFKKLAVRRGAIFNETTGFYELNGLTDITEAQMMDIYTYTSSVINAFTLDETFSLLPIRTNYMTSARGALGVSTRYAFVSSSIEVFKQNNLITSSCLRMFYNCAKLKIVDYISLGNTNASLYMGMFQDCPALETCFLRNIQANLSFQWSPLLSLTSLQYIIQYRGNGTTQITITVHPTVFAKLTDNVNYPTWYAVAQDALTKYITFATV